jgi:hypothetical protein
MTRKACFAVVLVFLAGCPAQEQPQRAAPAAPAAAPGPPATVREKAGVGSGEQGRGYGGGLITTPVAAYFAVGEKLVFEIEIPHALDLYKASEGHAPRTQDEFMREIVKANQIRLPALPPGHRYVYDPKSERLMVEHPPP